MEINTTRKKTPMYRKKLQFLRNKMLCMISNKNQITKSSKFIIVRMCHKVQDTSSYFIYKLNTSCFCKTKFIMSNNIANILNQINIKNIGL